MQETPPQPSPQAGEGASQASLRSLRRLGCSDAGGGNGPPVKPGGDEKKEVTREKEQRRDRKVPSPLPGGERSDSEPSEKFG